MGRDARRYSERDRSPLSIKSTTAYLTITDTQNSVFARVNLVDKTAYCKTH